jgi:predicted nucleic acid-binding protein
MTTELNKSELFRLAAVLYADNNYEVSTRVINRKVLDSALLDCDNNDLTIHKIIDYIEDKYSLLIGESEINDIIEKYPDSFLTNYHKDSKTICLSPKRRGNLESKIKKNNIDTYINLYILDKGGKEESIKKTLYDFLYHMFSINTASFQKLFDSKKDISTLISLQDSNFSTEQIDIINDFLNWDNTDKNKAIFDISSYALEFCLLTNKKGNSNLRLNNLKNKAFYLDTNVIYRAIGINGYDRKKRTSTFLNKFKEAGENLYISSITDEEFRNSIKFYIDKLKSAISPKSSSKVFLEFRSLKDIHSYYHNWRKDKTNSNLDLFQAYILSEYQTFIEHFNIKLDYNKPYDLDDKETDEYIKDLISGINNSKPEGKRNYYQSTLNDAENILWIEEKRDGKVENIFDTKYFFISSDNQLRKWDYYRGFKTPIVLLPSQWMSILLRYFDRTKDDYKSFVSFLNLRNNEKVIEGEKLNLILTGISEMTSNVEQQRYLVSHLIEKDFEGIITSNSSDSEIINKSKEFAKTLLEKQVSNLSKKVENLEIETTKKEQIIGSTIKTAKSKKIHNKELGNELTLAEKSNKKLIKENTELIIEKGISKWRRILLLYIPLSLLLIALYILALFFDDSNINIGRKILNHIDSQTSESTKNLLNTLFYLPIAAAGWMLWQSVNKFNNEKVVNKRKELKEKYENTTTYKNNKG